jgi:tRNA threonylcarbamoyladenosine biosynthesis protein TsaB
MSGHAPRSGPPILLAVDTSTRMVGLALYDGVQVISERAWLSTDHHTMELALSVQDVLAHSRLEIRSLAALGVAIGPGSFTSLRIGLALVKGMSLAQYIPIVGISSLQVLAAAQPVQNLPMAAVLRAGRGRLAVGWFTSSADTESGSNSRATGKVEMNTPHWRVTSMAVLTATELARQIQTPTIVCGELTEEERHLLERWKGASNQKCIILASPAASLRRPAFLAELAWRRWQHGNIDDPASLAPIYLHYGTPPPDPKLATGEKPTTEEKRGV